ncbi:universal stress protein [Oricola thermophila]|uniref:Universal stress protein n=1 Tax=Oricola thermophila TaxID=2742145 RepID=A0A6N1VB09_9HYPH|nr:universal stress protein [Oricola thermophila]QKV18146.1 universal stress protein [Oricola thermophila]
MFPKTLLTVVDSEQPADSVKDAIALCGEAGCHLAVLVVGIALPAATTAYGAVPAETWSEEREKGRVAAVEKATEIEAVLKKAGISGDVAPYFSEEGQIADIVGMRARYTDIGLVRHDDGMDPRLAKKILEGLIYQSARPFLYLPKGVKAALKPKRVLVGWNATKESARAVHAALDTLKEAEQVNIVLVDPLASEFGQGEEPGADIAAYLARHDIRVTVDVLASGGRSVSDTLLQHAGDVDAGLLVAGAYGHSRIREFLFGGATRDLLANEQIPVLMSH